MNPQLDHSHGAPRSGLIRSAPHAMAVAKPPSNPQLRILGNIARMHLIWTMLVGVILAAVSCALILRFWEPVYEAKAYVRVIQNPGYFQVIPEKFQTQTNPKDELAPIRSELLLSRALTDEVRRLPTIAKAKSKTKQLGEMISYRSAGGQELYEISCKSTSASEAAKLVSVVTDVFLDDFRQYRDSRLREISDDLSHEITAKRQEIKSINEALTTLASQQQGSTAENSIYDPDGEYLTELQKSRTDLEAELESLLAELDLAGSSGTESGQVGAAPGVAATAAGNTGEAGSKSSSPQSPAPLPDVEYAVESAPEVVRLKSERSNLQVQRRDKLSRGKGENHPEVKSIDLALRRIEQDLSDARSIARKVALAELVAANGAGGVVVGPGQQLVPARTADLQAKIAGMQRQLEHYNQEIDKQRGRIRETSGLRWDFDSKKVELARATAELDRLLDAESTLHFRQLSLPYQIARVDGDKVTTPEAPLEEYPLKLLGLALAASFGIPLGLAFLWETRAKRISEPDQLVQNLPCGVVGEVAMVPLRRLGAKGPVARLTRDRQVYQESVDKIGTLLALTAEEGNQVLAITSAVSHEGKSTLASQLAISLARSANQEVLLIDADLRSPVQHRLFDTTNMTGLVDAIKDPTEWEGAIHETKVPNLFILPAGRAPAKPASCFVNNSWEHLLQQAHSRFGIIIVDTPPVLSTSESVAICRAADRTLMCVLRDVSRTDAVHRAHAQLVAAQVNVLGCVFGGTRQSAYTYRYGGEYQAAEQPD